jgi:hypothetical protein
VQSAVPNKWKTKHQTYPQSPTIALKTLRRQFFADPGTLLPFKLRDKRSTQNGPFDEYLASKLLAAPVLGDAHLPTRHGRWEATSRGARHRRASAGSAADASRPRVIVGACWAASFRGPACGRRTYREARLTRREGDGARVSWMSCCASGAP